MNQFYDYNNTVVSEYLRSGLWFTDIDIPVDSPYSHLVFNLIYDDEISYNESTIGVSLYSCSWIYDINEFISINFCVTVDT
jgi:hypothetical protein